MKVVKPGCDTALAKLIQPILAYQARAISLEKVGFLAVI